MEFWKGVIELVQLSMFDLLYKEYKIDKPIRLIELFS